MILGSVRIGLAIQERGRRQSAADRAFPPGIMQMSDTWPFHDGDEPSWQWG